MSSQYILDGRAVADKHPYSPAGQGGVVAAINQLRKSFPRTVDAGTLKKLSIAPSNESYIINILKFIGAVDSKGNRTERAASVFSTSDDEFKKEFELMLKKAYDGLFDLNGEETWILPANKLKNYFRTIDQTSDVVGRNQASTFLALASFAEHGQPLSSTPTKSPVRSKPQNPPKEKRIAQREANDHSGENEPGRGFGLTVRIEVNLPAQADQETYDRIFRSIRENLLLNAK